MKEYLNNVLEDKTTKLFQRLVDCVLPTVSSSYLAVLITQIM